VSLLSTVHDLQRRLHQLEELERKRERPGLPRPKYPIASGGDGFALSGVKLYVRYLYDITCSGSAMTKVYHWHEFEKVSAGTSDRYLYVTDHATNPVP
jgi:hypothetical protein